MGARVPTTRRRRRPKRNIESCAWPLLGRSGKRQERGREEGGTEEPTGRGAGSRGSGGVEEPAAAGQREKAWAVGGATARGSG
jgi:hypothetical protein